MRFGFFKERGGFTLIELLTVMAIIGILSAAMLITLSVYKKRATASKLLLELSSAMQKVYLCISDGNQVAQPTGAGGGVICQDASSSPLPNYGRWPELPSGYSYQSSSSFGNSWFYMVTSGDDDLRICCNSTSGKCKKFDSVATCNATTDLN